MARGYADSSAFHSLVQFVNFFGEDGAVQELVGVASFSGQKDTVLCEDSQAGASM